MPREELSFGGLYNSRDITHVPKGKFVTGQNFTTDQDILGARQGYNLIGSRPGYSASDACWGIGYGIFACNETQSLTITGNPTGGTVVLRSPLNAGVNSTAVPWNAAATDVQTALAPWTSFDNGELVCSGGPWPNEPINVTYKGRYANAAQALITLQTNSLSGGIFPSLVIAHFVNGGPHEEYLVVIQPGGAGTSSLFSVTSGNSFTTTTWTQLTTGLTSSDWFFEQIEDKMFAENATDGLEWKQIGGAWSGTAGIPNVQSPIVAPTATPLFDVPSASAGQVSLLWNVGGNATFSAFTGWGATPPTVAVATGGGYLTVTVKTAIVTPTVVGFTASFHGNEDFSHADYWNWIMQSIIQTGDTVLVTQADPTSMALNFTSSGSVAVNPTFTDAGSDAGTSASAGQYSRNFHFGSVQRTDRSSTASVTFMFNCLQGRVNDIFTIFLFPNQTWMNDTMNTLDIVDGATIAAEKYAYSYLKASTGIESKLSLYGRSPSVPPRPFGGAHMTVTAPGSSQLTTSDFVKFYRTDEFGLWRFIGQVANATSGTVSFIDNNMLDELNNYPIFGVLHLPGGTLPSCLGVWDQCLVAGGDRKAFISKQGQYFFFAPDPEGLPAVQAFEVNESTDTGAPRTDYMSQTRAEPVISVVGQDSLYLFGPNTSYAMTSGGGDGVSSGANGLSPPRILPGARGCLSSRGSTAQSGGALAAAQAGLWYYAVSPSFTGTIQPGSIIQQEITEEVRGSWATLLGNTTGSAIVVVFYLDEIWVFNQNRYLKFTRNKKIEQGTFSDSIKDCVGNSNGLIFATSDGRLMKMGDPLTNPQTTDNGTAILWSATTGIMQNARQRLMSFELLYNGAPSVTVTAWDGKIMRPQKFDQGINGGVNFFASGANALLQGYKFQILYSGGVNDQVTMFAANLEPAQSKAP